MIQVTYNVPTFIVRLTSSAIDNISKAKKTRVHVASTYISFLEQSIKLKCYAKTIIDKDFKYFATTTARQNVK